MPWPVIWYTSYDAIRSVLGVSDEEGFLEDADLDSEHLESVLHLALTGIGSTLPTEFLAVCGTPPVARTEAQANLALLVPLFATLCVARQVGVSLPMSAKTITDGKASFSRFADAPYKETLARLEAEFQVARTALASAYSTLTGAGGTPTVLPTLLAGAGASVDRVTNE